VTPASGTVLIDGYEFPITPVENLGITGLAPDVDIETYRLTIDGLVDTPLVLGYADISKYPMVSQTPILDCPGFFIDIAEWTGVPVSRLLADVRVLPEATQASFYAIDGYVRTFALADVLKDGVFLALKVNGQILPKEHGYPLRLVMEGKEGNNWIKWVNRIEIG
jgi:sulfoxide reductase catalytic subunit YedY